MFVAVSTRNINYSCRSFGKSILNFKKLLKLFSIKVPFKKTAESIGQTVTPFGEKDRRRRIMVFGDSNAYRPGNGRDCWPAMIQGMSGKTLWVINESCDGRTTHYDSGTCNGLKIIEWKIRRALPLDLIIIALGTNDLKSKYGPPTAAEIVMGIDKMVEIINKQYKCIRILLVTPPSLGNVTIGELAGAQDRIPRLVTEYHSFAAVNNIPIVDLYQKVNTLTDLEPDCVHLNARGRRKVAGILWKNLQEVCKKIEPDS
jgi:lysophospholipase L1-like esterase